MGSQTGIAIGMALLAGGQLHEMQDTKVSLVLSASTVVFELIGPLAIRRAVSHAHKQKSAGRSL